MNDNDMILYEKLSYFKEHKIVIHIAKTDGRFNNGLILELAKDHLILDDKVFGGIPIYFLEIKFVEKKKEVENG